MLEKCFIVQDFDREVINTVELLKFFSIITWIIVARVPAAADQYSMKWYRYIIIIFQTRPDSKHTDLIKCDIIIIKYIYILYVHDFYFFMGLVEHAL